MSATALEEFKKIKNEMEELRFKAKEKVENAFQEGARELFDEHSNLESFSWSQYTPYFNDGDPCVFEANYEDSLNINEIHIRDVDCGWLLNQDGSFPKKGNASYKSFKKYFNQEKYDQWMSLKSLAEVVTDFLKIFSNDDFESAFGDGVEVTVTKEGIETNEYDHD